MKNLLGACFFTFSFVYIAMSCSQIVKVSPDFEGVDSKAKKYVDYIYRVGSRYGTVDTDIYNITLGFDDLEGTVVGTCRLTLFPLGQEITIDNTYWNASSEIRRFMLVLHEISHCYFHRLHTEDLMDDFCPVSVMYPTTIHENCHRRHFKHYIKEALGRDE